MSYYSYEGYIKWYSLYFFCKKSIKMLKKYLTLQVFNGIIYSGGEGMDDIIKIVVLATTIINFAKAIVELITTVKNGGK